MKSEPDVYSIDDLARDHRTSWEGVRNYQARNSMRDDMRVGDLVPFYHSTASPAGVAGVAKVARTAYADPTQWDAKSTYYDASVPKGEERWCMVDVEFVEAFDEVVPLDVLKKDRALATMLVVQKGQRLSVQPVEPAHFARTLMLGKAKTRVRA